MKEEISLIKANNYLYFSYYCDDPKPNNRLRYPTGVKVDDNTKSGQSRISDIEELINKYIGYYRDIDKKPILKAEIKAYLDKELNPPNENIKPYINTFWADWDQMMKDMLSGQILKKDKNRYSPKTVEGWEDVKEFINKYEIAKATSLNYEMSPDDFGKLIGWFTLSNYSKNTIAKIVAILFTFLKITKQSGKHSNTIYENKDLYYNYEKGDAISPSFDDLITLYNHPFKRAAKKARDLFVFGCFIGLRIGDLGRINSYKLTGSSFVLLTNKSKVKVEIPVHWLAKKIYEEYEGSLPVFKYHAFYYHISKLFKAAGINSSRLIVITIGGVKIEQTYEKWELMAPHSMRRFCATYLHKIGIPPKKAMKITGHKKLQSYLDYIKIEDEENAMEIQQHPAFNDSNYKISW